MKTLLIRELMYCRSRLSAGMMNPQNFRNALIFNGPIAIDKRATRDSKNSRRNLWRPL